MYVDPPDDITGAGALGDTIGGMFDIPEMNIEDQIVGTAQTPQEQPTDVANEIIPTSIEYSDAASDLGDLF